MDLALGDTGEATAGPTTPLDGAVVARICLMPHRGGGGVEKQRRTVGIPPKPSRSVCESARALQNFSTFLVLVPVLLCVCTSSLGVPSPLYRLSLCPSSTGVREARPPALLTCNSTLPSLPLYTPFLFDGCAARLHCAVVNRCF